MKSEEGPNKQHKYQCLLYLLSLLLTTPPRANSPEENFSYPNQESRRRNTSKEPGFNGGRSFERRRLVSRVQDFNFWVRHWLAVELNFCPVL
jgi:hypothetical protein